MFAFTHLGKKALLLSEYLGRGWGLPKDTHQSLSRLVLAVHLSVCLSVCLSVFLDECCLTSQENYSRPNLATEHGFKQTVVFLAANMG